eukprot:CAMPEP_0172428374 /NCGR_PEP_ID=MMETSP1064-20121228/46123_1 /TAXON_ID=202472 /ORGANISM="Aulacoseira subarctica , Strain CCAP 1002/5" /LENGTH=168 /DNA_ID=CAMNT_0013173119 /DNA_START=204 /DNA_END=710 /DNA_ORIENTATION=-
MFTEVYTHMATKGAEFLLRDILVKAEPYFRLNNYSISSAITDPDAFQLLTDSIIDVIEFSENPMLAESKGLIHRFKGRDLYMPIDSPWRLDDAEEKLLENMSEMEMKQALLQVARLCKDDVSFDVERFILEELIIEQRLIHHGMKRENPTNFCRFLSKHQILTSESLQ